MKKITAIVLTCVMLMALLAVGGREAKANEQITITFASFHMENEVDSVIFTQPWLQMIQDACAEIGYDLEFECYWGGTLCSLPESFEATKQGVADMSLFLTAMPGVFNAENVLIFPWNGYDVKYPSAVYETIFQEFPEVQAEYAGTHVLCTLVEGGQELNSNKYFETLEESHEQNILWSSVGEVSTKVIDAWGWSPVSLLPDETYSALERGIVDGTSGAGKTMKSMAWNEVTANRYLNLWIINQLVSVVMNEDVWNSLPAEVQEVFNYYSIGGEFNVGKFYDEAITAKEEELKPELGMNLIELPVENVMGFQEKVDEAADAYAAELGTTAILERVRELIAPDKNVE